MLLETHRRELSTINEASNSLLGYRGPVFWTLSSVRVLIIARVSELLIYIYISAPRLFRHSRIMMATWSMLSLYIYIRSSYHPISMMFCINHSFSVSQLYSESCTWFSGFQ
jgi:hypothetical protein